MRRSGGGPGQRRGASGTRGVSHRPWTRAAVAALAGHVAFELGAGVGMPLASVAGPAPSAALWAAQTAWVVRRAGRPGADGVLAAVNGFGLAAIAAHLAGWPRRSGLPWLADCEGLGPHLMRWYNPILYAGAGAALTALTVENRRAPWWAGPAPLALVPLLVAAQHAEHRRLVRIAAARPAWWNRRLTP